MSKIYIVGTPIGNLGDITLRAIETLKLVDVIACEDTRVTRKLLSSLDIRDKFLLAYHDRNEKNSAQGLIKLAKEGKNIAVVSDAGMPTISDPGFEIIAQAKINDISFEVIPGVSAVTMVSALSNFDTHFKFEGFLKPKTGQRKNQLKKWQKGTHIIYVSPHNIMKIMDDIIEIHGEDTCVFVGRELTKQFESHYHGNALEVKKAVESNVKGEFSMAIEIKKEFIND